MSSNTILRVAIVGCGNISAHYARTMAKHADTLRLVGVYDLQPAAAEKLAAEHHVRTYASLDEVLGDDQVDVVANLTIHQAHYDVIGKAIKAGKHVHTEKPLTLDVKQAFELVELARQHNVRLSSAPITFMGEAQQTAWQAIRQDRLGQVRVIYAEMNWGRIESWHPNPGPFYQVGAFADVGVYPLTLLTAMFGPVKRVTGVGRVVHPRRKTSDGTPFELGNTPDWAVSVLEFASGPICRITASFYVGPTMQHGVEFHGDKASMFLSSAHDFNATVQVRDFGASEWQSVPYVREPYPGVDWSCGLVDMAHAIRENRTQRPTGAQAAHVVEIIFATYQSSNEGRPIDLTSTFQPPAPMDWANAAT